MRRKTRPYWTCRRCSFRNLRQHVKCRGEGCEARRPKKRVPKHAVVLRDMNFEQWCELSYEIHGRHAEYAACGVCGRHAGEDRRNDRDHDHRTGQARGLACFRCNRELLRNTTLEEARLVVAYLERVEAHYARQAVAV